MEYIFHEKQEGSLCAQHCLNALLQSSEFTAVDLSEIARNLDDDERRYMAEAGSDTVEYQRFLQQPSANYDDSGFFSVQVLQKALEVWNLEMVQFSSQHPVAAAAKQNPVDQWAYICNLREHWLTLRKIGDQWFNLNSLLTAPELISDTYLHLYIEQLKTEGFSIFVVVGNRRPCEADEVLRLIPAQPTPRQATRVKRTASEIQDPELAAALEESRKLTEPDDDAALQRALQISLQDTPGMSVPLNPVGSGSGPSQQAVGSSLQDASAAPDEPVDPDDIRRKRLQFFENQKS